MKTLQSILILAALLPLAVFAQNFTKQRTVSKSFKVHDGASVQITNKYGNINVIPWQKDSVLFQVNMSVQGKQMAKVDKIMASIDFEMMSFGNYINARTYFRDNQATFWKDVVSYANQVINTSNNLQIDYTVYMPASTDLKIDDKFGNIYAESHTGKVDIKLANGDLQARDFEGNLKLYIEFGSATLGDVNQGDFDVNYSDLTLNKINSMNLNSRSSTIEIEKAKNMEISSHRDKINIKECAAMNGDASFSKIKIMDLESAATISSKYGEFKANSVSRNFHNIHLNAEYTDLFLSFEPTSSFTLDLTYDSKTKVNLSQPLSAQLKKDIIDPKIGTVNATASVGKSANSLVYVNARAGSLTIFNK
ncbi:MAG: hypothetical protein HXX13_04705 [Bacteroidetes bacterium]|nr:hypothetical protein [Bacteroidota bacterium]